MKLLIRIFFIISVCLFLFKTFIPVSAQVQPIQHLNATIAGSIILESDSVVQWTDQSVNGNNGEILTGKVLYPSSSLSVTGIAGLDFSDNNQLMELFSSAESDAILDFAGTASENSGFAIIIAFKVDEIISNWNDLIGNNSAMLANQGLGIRFSNSGTFQVYLGEAHIQAGSLEAGQSVVFGVNYNASTGAFDFWNSNDKTVRSATVPAKDFSNTYPILLGGLANPIEGRYFDGMIGEVKIFNEVLGEEDFLSLSNELTFKWALADYEPDPPTPDPAAFDIAPKSITGTLVMMKAAEGTDEHEPVEYLFEEISGNSGGSNSGWTRNSIFRDGDLEPDTQYQYTVTMRDAYGNIGGSSDPISVTTPDNVPERTKNDLDSSAYYGYQGWHFAPGDGRIESNNWVHWFNNNTPDEDNIHGDMWPDLSEYDQENLYPTDLKYPNGETVKTYSCFDYSTIDLHIKWMRDYGLNGCVVQRFSNSIDKSYNLEQGDKKILDVMTACEKYGVQFYVMHDAGAGDPNEVKRVTDDWKHLVDDLEILQSPAYAYQDGKPVYGLWGIGVTGKREWTPAQVNQILDTHNVDNSPYQSYVVGGLGGSWYSGREQEWGPVYERLNMIMPWRTLFYDPYSTSRIDGMYQEKAWCDTREIDYLPVVSPGASAGNIGLAEGNPNKKRNGFPRDGGYRLWKQAYEVCKMSQKFMYIAMFDEVDEGTAMYKQVPHENGLPENCRQLSLDEDGYDLPTDWYLQLGTQIQKMMDGRSTVSEEMPITPKKLFELFPSPEDGATGVDRYPILAWNSISLAQNYKVYLRKGLSIFSESDLIASQADTAIVITDAFEEGATYYWRIDVLTNTQRFPGQIWSFKVEESSSLNIPKKNQVKIYPVPAENQILIQGGEENAPYSVYNLIGKKQFDGILGGRKTINIHELSPGVYLLVIEGKILVKFLKK